MVENWELEVNPKNLDILLISKYGQKHLGPVARQFSNNVGVITDKEGLASLVKELYWTPWTKSYQALNAEYGVVDPYHMKTTVDQTDNRDIKLDGTETETKTGTNKDTVESTNTNTTDTVQTTSGTVQQSGSDTTTTGNHASRSNTELTNLDSIHSDDVLGVTHQITENVTEGTDTRTTQSTESQPPYDTDAMKDVLKRGGTDTNTSSSSNKLNEKTLDKSVVTNTGEDNGSSNEETTYGKKDTTSGSVTDKGTVTDTLNTTNTETINETVSGTEEKTTTDDLIRHVVTDEAGNNWAHTNQDLITQELELRRRNLYDMIISDVVRLITLSIY